MKKTAMRNGRSLVAGILVSGMLFSFFPMLKIRAAGAIGKVTVNGVAKEYTSLGDLVDDVDDYKKKTIIIDMYCDWNSNTRLCIPSDSKTTLNMHGHKYDRGLSSDKTDGEVIWIGSDAVVTINGSSNSSERNTTHNVKYYYSASRSAKAGGSRSFNGGVITGGYSSNGAGGIDIKSNVTLTLNDVTIAGCRAEQSWGTDGYGGGIWVHGGVNAAGSIIMNNSTIFGCYAYNDGGGLYQSNHDNFILEMNESHIDSNYCYNQGGGIDVDGETVMILGDGKSTVSDNHTNGGSGDEGGGIYIWNDGVTVSGLHIYNNSAYRGGGIFTQEETITISDCVIECNDANDRGGGIYVNNDENSISNCTITGNTAKNEGDGIYINTNVDEGMNISGKMIVRNNGDQNIYVEDSSRINFTLTRGSEVYMRYRTMPSTSKMVTEGKVGDEKKTTNCIRFLHSDAAGYHFTFNNAPNSRKIYLVKDGYTSDEVGSSYVPSAPEVITSQMADEEARTPVSGKTIVGSHAEYSVYRGYFRHPQAEDGSNTYAVYYYSDGYFDADPKEYNAHLATFSTCFAMAGMYLNQLDYQYKHASIRQMMSDIGVDDQHIYVNDFNTQKPGTDTIGVTIGWKELKDKNGSETGYYLMPVVVRGGNYEAEWASNMKLGSGDEGRDGEALGFSEAADQVCEEIENYIKKYDLRDKVDAGKVKFYVTGFSRAGATSNITAKRLIEKYQAKNDQVFAYCIEAPQGGTDNAQKLPASNYFSIHNVINYADVVPLVAPSSMGFKRYGVDHYVPGTEAGEVKENVSLVDRAGSHSNVTERTVYSDNDPILTKTNGSDNPTYISKRTKMQKQLYAVDSTLVFDDYFHGMSISFIPGVSIDERGSYELYEEQFIRDFFEIIQSWALNSRDDWTKKTTLNGVRYASKQQALGIICSLIFGLDSDTSNKFITKASTIMTKISTASFSEYSLLDIYSEVIYGWRYRTEGKKMSIIQFFWDKLDSTGALDVLNDTDVRMLKNAWPTLADLIFTLLNEDALHYYIPIGMHNVAVLGTFAGNASRILSNHYPEVDLAWFRAEDSFYDNETKDYEVADAAQGSTNVPAAYMMVDPVIDEETGEPVDGNSDPTRVDLTEGEFLVISGGQKLILDVENVEGEAIYYTLDNNGCMLDERIYRGGIDLPLADNGTTAIYRIRTHACSHYVESRETVYLVKIVGENHEVRVSGLVSDAGSVMEKTEKTYNKAGDTVHVSLPEVPDSKFFQSWKVFNENGKDVTSLVIPEVEKQTATEFDFVIPECNEEDLSLGYTLTFKAQYGDIISHMDLKPYFSVTRAGGFPTVGGDELAVRVETPIDGEKSVSFRNLEWSYIIEDPDTHEILTMKALRGDKAFNNTKYMLDITLEETADIRFAENMTVNLDVNCDGVFDENDQFTMTKNEDGTVTLHVEFMTGEGDPTYAPEKAKICDVHIEVYDLNDPETELTEYHKVFHVLVGQSVELIPAEIPGKAFQRYEKYMGVYEIDSKTNVLRTEPSTSQIIYVKAYYLPEITKVEIEVGGEGFVPEAYQPSPETIKHAYITTDKRYEVVNSGYKNNIVPFRMDWTPSAISEPSYPALHFDYFKEYTLTVNYAGGGIGEINLIDPDGTQVTRGTRFVLSDDFEIIIDGRKAEFDGTHAKISFPRTASSGKYLISYKVPEDIKDVPHGKTSQELLDLLPEKTEVFVSDNGVSELSINWSQPTLESSGSSLEAQIWNVHGSVRLKRTDYNNELNIDTGFDIKIYVLAADTTAAPEASISSGKYSRDLSVELFTETANGKIYYTVDGTDPENGVLYEEPVSISEADLKNGQITLRAITKKDGMYTSAESVFVYEYTNLIRVPKGNELVANGQSQIGVEGDAHYELFADQGGNVTIDADGNAVATEAGTYKVRAKIKDGYVWDTGARKKPDSINSNGGTIDGLTGNISVDGIYDESEPVITTDDQIIEFTIEDGVSTEPEFKSQAVTLSGQIGVFFYMDLPEMEGVDYTKSYMTFDIEGSGTITPRADFDASKKNSDGTLYGFDCYVNAIQLADTITATFHYQVEGETDERMVSKIYSVRKYCETVEEIEKKKPGTYDETTLSMVRAMADYGHYVQPMLSKVRNWTIGKEYAEMDMFFTGNNGAAGYDIDAIYNTLVENGHGKNTVNTSNGVIHDVTYSLKMDSEMAIFVYFTPDSAFTVEVDGVEVTVPASGAGQKVLLPDGTTAEVEVLKNGQYRAAIRGILAQDLDNRHTLVVSVSDSEKLTMNVSSLSYVQSLLEYYTEDDMKDAAASIYSYWKAAEAYVEAHKNA